MSTSDKMKILNDLHTRAKCPDCGRYNKCALEEGKSASTCWCMTEKVPDKSPEHDVCLCKTCFREWRKK